MQRGTLTRVLIALSSISVAHSYISIRTTSADGTVTAKKAQDCKELAPGVNYCQEMGTAGEDELLDIVIHEAPSVCGAGKAVKAESQLLMHYTGKASLAPSEEGSWFSFVVVDDFTHASAVKMGVGEVPKGWDMALLGYCQGTKATLTIPPSLGFDSPNGKPQRPASVPIGATLRYDIEIISVLAVDSTGVPFRPCFFSLIDTDDSGDLDEVEVRRSRVQPWPSALCH